MSRSAQCSVRARSKAAATPGRGFVATSAARVESENLLEPALVARLAAGGRAQERGRALERKLRPDHPRAERQDVHVVVLDALVGGVRVMADRRAYAADLVRGDRRTHAGAADE